MRVDRSPPTSRYRYTVGPDQSKIDEDADIQYVIPLDVNTLIGVTGPMAAGKTSLASYLREEKDFTTITLSVLLRREAREQGWRTNRLSLKNLGDKLRRDQGPDILARLALAELRSASAPFVVIDGIRNPAEIRRLRKNSHFYAVAVDASQRDRWKRLRSHPKSGDVPMTFAEFKRWDERDRGISHSDPNGQNIDACIALVRSMEAIDRGFYIRNTSKVGPTAMYRRVDEVLAQLGFRV